MMTHSTDFAVETARVRLSNAKEKFERQQKRYAIHAMAGGGSGSRKLPPETLEAKALMVELEGEFQASQEALRKLVEKA
jgi:hypothetical protein